MEIYIEMLIYNFESQLLFLANLNFLAFHISSDKKTIKYIFSMNVLKFKLICFEKSFEILIQNI